ncbi:MAG: hypothetical protein V3T17_13075 [Pseudomonadales bacterium]
MTIQTSIVLSVAAFALTVIVSRWQQLLPAEDSNSTAMSMAVVPLATFEQPRPLINDKRVEDWNDAKGPVDITIPPPAAQKMLAQLQGAMINGKLVDRYYPKTQREALTSANSYLPEEVAIPLNVKVSNALSVDVNHQAIAEVRAGDIISMALPSGESVEIHVVHSRPTASGARIVSGYVAEYGEDYPVLVTTRGEFTTATIPTPAGEYILEALNGKGWVYEPPNLNELLSPDSTDTLRPPIDNG